ncbi:MAG: hypothetical protein R3D69_14520 [Xanthobacteraceae bacterium]
MLEWYPLGRLLLWICAFACLITASALFTLGSDYESITTALRRGLARIISARDGAPPDTDTDRVMDMIAQIAPSAATLVAMFTLTLNLWLASKIVRMSGRLRRPWPDLSGTELPSVAMIALAAAMALSFADGLLAMLSQIASSAADRLSAGRLRGAACHHPAERRAGVVAVGGLSVGGVSRLAGAADRHARSDRRHGRIATAVLGPDRATDAYDLT